MANNEAPVQAAAVAINVNPVPQFDPHGDQSSIAHRWKKWVRNFETFAMAAGCTQDAQKRQLLLHTAGSAVQDIFDTLENTGNTYDQAKTKLNTYFTPYENKSYNRHMFRKEIQKEGESVSSFATRLRQLSVGCGYTDAQVPDFIRDQIIDNCRSEKLQIKLLAQRDLTLDQALAIAQAMESAETCAAQMKGSQVNRVHARNKYPPKPNPQQQQRHRQQQPQKQQQSQKQQQVTRANRPSKERHPNNHPECQYCGYHHGGSRNNCPASGQTCKSCHKLGHFARKCLIKQPQGRPRRTHCIQEDSSPAGQDPDSFVFKVGSKPDGSSTVKVRLNGILGKMELDTCADVNIMDEECYKKVCEHSKAECTLEETSIRLLPYLQDNPLEVRGKFTASLESVTTGSCTQADIFVVGGKSRSHPLMCYNTGKALGIVHIVNATSTASVSEVSAPDKVVKGLMTKYNSVFTGLGKHKSVKAKFIVDESVAPVALKQRRIPYNLERKAQAEEDRLCDLGIIENVPENQPTTWCTNPVIAPKPHNPDKIRYCSDMRVPNQAIKRPVTDILNMDDLRVKLSGSAVFSVLDMNEGYHQIELEEASRHLTTFYGTRGKMRYTRLNYGTISAQDIFDKAMDDTIDGLDGVCHIRDDFIVHGKNDQDHNKHLESLLRRFQDEGLTLNPEKCKFRVSEVEFFGFIYSKDGVRPSPSKIAALQNMTPPQNTQEVRSLLGMAQYSAQFIPRFSEITTPLRQLTHQNTKWQWTEKEQSAFEKLRNALSDSAVLSYYETGQPTRLSVDAGPNGLGAILFQRKAEGWKPVACVSRALTPVETRYSQLEREALAIRWACEKLYKYLIGARFEIQTDHMPLIPMFTKPHSRPPMRIERWLLYLQQFDYTIEYCPGIKNAADYLSRHTPTLTKEDIRQSEARDAVVRSIIADTIPRAIPLQEIKEETAKDKALTRLRQLIQMGDYHSCKKDPELKSYAGVFTELCTVDGLILRGSQIVLPTQLQLRAVKICHEGHLGIVKTKQLLRSKIWFPGIDRAVETEIAHCLPCQASVNDHAREPLKMSSLPRAPWVEASADLCGPFPTGEMVLVVLDAYSRYPEVEVVPGSSADVILPALEKIFATHGVPEELKTDNGPPFQSATFRSFAQEKGFHHRKITPLWPEANGQVEAFMKNIGKVARTAHMTGKDWTRELYVFLANYRDTPHPCTGKSPYELSMGRIVRTKVPKFHQHPTPEDPRVRTQDLRSKMENKIYADARRHATPHEIRTGDTVLVRQPKSNKFSTPYSSKPYVVEDVKGSMILASHGTERKVRNSSHFKRIDSRPDQVYPPVEEELDDVPTENPVIPIPVPPETLPVPVPEPTMKPGSPTKPDVTRSGRPIKKPQWLQDYVK